MSASLDGTAIFSLLFFLFLLPKMESKNYVILSLNPQGLREVRLAYRGKYFMETSLAEEFNEKSVTYTRASDGDRMVETVVRHGLIDDCYVTSKSSDISTFVSEFYRLLPVATPVNESFIRDVYVGRVDLQRINVNDVTARNNFDGRNNSFSRRIKSSRRLHILDKNRTVVMSDIDAKNSSFFNSFRHFLRVRKMRRECKDFYIEAEKKLELLSFLTDQPEVDGHSAFLDYLNHTVAGGVPEVRRQHRRRHHRRPHAGFDHDRYLSSPAPINATSSEYLLQGDLPVEEGGYASDERVQNVDFLTSESNMTERTGGQSLRTAGNHEQFQTGSDRTTYESSEVRDDLMMSDASFSSDARSRSRRDLLTGWMIFPGTKWCGDGDIAENKSDLGYHAELDKCCRRHDLCPQVIPRLTWKYGMFNYRLHTLSHCRCDRKFRKCLKASGSPLAQLIGKIFFNVVGPQCFKFTHETACTQRFWWGGCKEWGTTKVAYLKQQRRFK